MAPAPAPDAPDRPGANLEAPKLCLVVEDEPAVRRLVTQILQSAGILVLSAGCGAEALALREAHAAELDLLVTDIVMPGMTGPEVARAFRAVRPRLPVLFMSGYADEVVAHEGMNAAAGAFIAKPFTPATFLAKVRALLPTARATAATLAAPHGMAERE